MIDYIVNRTVDVLDLDPNVTNVTNTAYCLNPEFTPAYSVLALELTAAAGYQLRITGAMHSCALLPLAPTNKQIDAATKKALRTLMKGMRDQALAWLEANPE